MLYKALQHSFGDLKKSSFNCLELIMSGITRSRSAQISRIARAIPSSAQFASTEKRISRFLSDVPINDTAVARFSSKLLTLDRNQKWTICIDRTNWKYGSTYRNLLIIGVLYKDQCVPLMSHNLGLQRKSGNSNCQDRIDIMDEFMNAFPKQKIQCIIGDREFIGRNWMDFLNKNNISFIVRLKEEWAVINDKDNQRTIPIKDYILPLMKDRRVLHLKVLLGATKPEEAFITVFWVNTRDEKTGKQKKELCIVQHSKDIKHPQREYKKRWKIESCFKNMKSAGFNIESSHLINEERFDDLIKIVLMCVAWMLYEGKQVKVIIKSNGFRWFSLFRSGLDSVLQSLINREKPPLFGHQNVSKPA